MSMAFLSQYHHLSCLLGTFSKVCCIVICSNVPASPIYVYGLPFTISSSLMFARDFLKGKLYCYIFALMYQLVQSMYKAFLSRYCHLSGLPGTFSKVSCIVICSNVPASPIYVYGLPFTVSSSLMFARDFLKGKLYFYML